ncbi:hypothetical protein Nmel_010584 [Mimus melanotis]
MVNTLKCSTGQIHMSAGQQWPLDVLRSFSGGSSRLDPVWECPSTSFWGRMPMALVPVPPGNAAELPSCAFAALGAPADKGGDNSRTQRLAGERAAK